MFVNRQKELAILDAYYTYIKSDKQINLALFGLRRIGKTELLLHFKKEHQHKNVLIPYLNLQKIVPDLATFSKQFLIELVYEQASKTKKVEKPVTLEELLILAAKTGEIKEQYITKLAMLLGQRTIDENAVLTLVFSFPEKIVQIYDSKVIYILDEFQEIIHVHSNILQIMRALTEKQKRINYWVSGSVFTAFDELFGYKNPFFGQFNKMKLTGFDRESSYELIDTLLPIRISAAEKNNIYGFTGGQPYYITAICERIIQEYAIQKTVTKDLVKYCILQELFGETGKINEHFEYLIDVSLSKFTNKEIYKKILLYLSQKPDTLSSISRHVTMPSGELSSYLKTLLKTDLIWRDGNIYRVRDPLFEGWIAKIYHGLDRLALQDKTIFDTVYAELQEKYVRAATELGKAKEYELKNQLETQLGVPLSRYVTADGQIEFDLVGKKNDIVYIVEIKWRTRPFTIKNLLDFITNVQQSTFALQKKQLYVISKSGFDTKTLESAKKHNVICLDKTLTNVE